MCGCGSNNGWAPFFPTFGAGELWDRRENQSEALCRKRETRTKQKSEWKPGFQVLIIMDYQKCLRTLEQVHGARSLEIHYKPKKEVRAKIKSDFNCEERPGN